MQKYHNNDIFNLLQDRSDSLSKITQKILSPITFDSAQKDVMFIRTIFFGPMSIRTFENYVLIRENVENLEMLVYKITIF